MPLIVVQEDASSSLVLYPKINIMERELSLNLGHFVGAYINFHFLPTLNTDLLASNCVINVSEEDFEEYNNLHMAYTRKYMLSTNIGLGETNEFKSLRAFRNKLARKYLPETLECWVPKIFEGVDVQALKDGIKEYLWDTDLCWYSLRDEDIKIEFLIPDSWKSHVYLKLETKD